MSEPLGPDELAVVSERHKADAALGRWHGCVVEGDLWPCDAARLVDLVEQREAEVRQRDERIAELEKQRRVLVSQLWEATRSEGRLHAALHEIKRRLNYYEPDLHGCVDIIDDALTSGG